MARNFWKKRWKIDRRWKKDGKRQEVSRRKDEKNG